MKHVTQNTYYKYIKFPIWLECDFRGAIENLGLDEEENSEKQIEIYARIWNIAVSKLIEYSALNNND